MKISNIKMNDDDILVTELKHSSLNFKALCSKNDYIQLTPWIPTPPIHLLDDGVSIYEGCIKCFNVLCLCDKCYGFNYLSQYDHVEQLDGSCSYCPNCNHYHNLIDYSYFLEFCYKLNILINVKDNKRLCECLKDHCNIICTE